MKRIPVEKLINKFLRSPQVKVANRYLSSFPEFKTPACNPKNPSSNDHLAWMLVEISKNKMSRPKANRWLGYVQSKMEDKGMITVAEERELTRSVFNGL